MCGIAGIVMRTGNSIPEGWIENAKQALKHRGPDGNSHFETDTIALVHTRLAIIDITGGNQPFIADNGTVLVANGEIYNYQELAATLPEGVLRSHSDCEIPLHLYRRDGIEGWQALRGMYAMALYDPAQGAVLIARDPFGIKPLYYTVQPDYIAFASELATLLDTGLVPPRERLDAVTFLLDQQYTPGKQTAVEGILRVLPGENLRIAPEGVTSLGRFQPQKQTTNHMHSQVEPALEALDVALRRSIHLHAKCDVPYGMFLSGGIDSATVLTLMAQELSKPPLAFTAFFPDAPDRNEAEHAATLCKATGATHITVPYTEKDFWQDLTAVVRSVDDPIADYAILPTFALAREARKHVKVILSGEGGDEHFAGYGRYRKLLRPWWLGGKNSLSAPRLLSLIPELRRYPGLAQPLHLKTSPQARLTPYLQWECDHWLADDLLIKLDRCLMAHSIEGRTPLVDREIAALAWQLPDHFKINHGLGKWLLRMWLDRQLPEAQAFAAKRGFTVPVDRWLMAVKDRLVLHLQRQECLAQWVHLDRLDIAINKAPIERAGRVLWGLLYYTLWHKLHIERIAFSDDAWEVLG
jgi:asparagine synthase (glutamine-hydrolysing)